MMASVIQHEYANKAVTVAMSKKIDDRKRGGAGVMTDLLAMLRSTARFVEHCCPYRPCSRF